MRRFATVAVLGLTLVAMSIVGASQAAPKGRFAFQADPGRPGLSGVADPTVLTGTEGVTASASVARVQAAARSDDIQANGDNKARADRRFGSGEGLPANETSIAINPTDQRNVIGGANDYEPGVDSVMGIYTSFNGGRTWPWSRHARQIITESRKMLGSGDPVIAFDSEGVAYATFIAFGRDDCDSYIAVIRSEDKGVTWTVPVDAESPGTGFQVGDGITVHNGGPDDCQIFHDKEWMTTGPRPDGVPLVEGTDPDHTSPDRLYVTWTRFDFAPAGDTFVEAPIYLAYSDDQGRHWSPEQEISGSNEEFCQPQFGDIDPPACDENQFSVPVVDPRDGTLHVAFENFNMVCCEFNQYMIVRSDDGGQTFSDPVRITEVADGPDKYPICEGSQVLDDMCARVNAAGNIDIDPRNGTLYLAFADNRNGTATDTDTDVLISKSTDGGATWSPVQQITTTEDDQFFPWLSVAPNGIVAVTYFDRQFSDPLIDTSLAVSRNAGRRWSLRRVSEVSWDPNLAFRLGIFIGDYNGLDTTRTTAIPFWTDARFAEPNVEGNNPQHQQSDVMVDVEQLRRRR
ncbi:MAG: sialidase family protein [Actinomycetota bacterium]